jgi:hypothetical protein
MPSAASGKRARIASAKRRTVTRATAFRISGSSSSRPIRSSATPRAVAISPDTGFGALASAPTIIAAPSFIA